MSDEKEVVLRCKRINPKAVLPTRRDGDVGYDLTAIGMHGMIDENTCLLKTGLVVQPPQGYYTKVVPRSSISKRGMVLSNSVGIIDPSYRGELLIALTRVNKSIIFPPQLPFKVCQLIVEKLVPSTIMEVDFVNSTKRGSGGFGSTDKN